MSNLGKYQTMTTVAKIFGGPVKFIGAVFGAGALIGIPSGIVIKGFVEKGVDFVRKKRLEKEAINGITYTVTSEGTDKQGLHFMVGDDFKVLEADGNAILIEKIGDENNPYVVSADFLSSISAFKL